VPESGVATTTRVHTCPERGRREIPLVMAEFLLRRRNKCSTWNILKKKNLTTGTQCAIVLSMVAMLLSVLFLLAVASGAENTRANNNMSKEKSVAVKTEVLPAVPQTDYAKFDDLAKSIVTKTGELGTLYFDLCMMIRKAPDFFSPKVVAARLSDLGFHRVRISEINRVARADEKVFSQWQARALGFNRVLQLARGNDGKIIETKAKQILVESGALSKTEAGKIVEAETTPGPDKKKRSNSEIMKSAARVLCNNATRNVHYHFEDCRYEVFVKLMPAKSAAALGSDNDGEKE